MELLDGSSQARTVIPRGPRPRGVKVLSRRTGYKVTINWLDANGRRISYDNDWQGNDRPTEWSPHGGVFTSPKNAASAELILGRHLGVKILLDDVSLRLNEGEESDK